MPGWLIVSIQAKLSTVEAQLSLCLCFSVIFFSFTFLQNLFAIDILTTQVH